MECSAAMLISVSNDNWHVMVKCIASGHGTLLAFINRLLQSIVITCEVVFFIALEFRTRTINGSRATETVGSF